MKRIAALDMLRGYALVCIMLDHMPISVLRNLTLSNFAVFDAAELFVLLSGFLVGMVWVKVEAKEGQWAAQKRFLKRAVQVWLALVIGAVILALFSALLFALHLNHTTVWFQYSRWIFEHPLGYLATVALMWMQPNLMDVLALYVLLIATAPVTVPFLLRWPVLALAVSVLVWFFAEPLNALVPNQRPGPGLLFNPFGWQLLFFVGVAMGAFRDRLMPVLMRRSRLLTGISAAILIFSLTIVITWKIGPAAKPFAQFLRQFQLCRREAGYCSWHPAANHQFGYLLPQSDQRPGLLAGESDVQIPGYWYVAAAGDCLCDRPCRRRPAFAPQRQACRRL